ncbi:MAG: GspJ family type II secretion system protein [Proteobacteria bacterium]|jgi:prepilin-type N-terminal cleavage/methylation domain-containing protein|nr:GspJ family type II secretion system protein [Pseudomonadota bacterium]
MNKKGFTLLEIMIVLAIMATLAVLAAQSLQQSVNSKIKVQKNIDEMSRVRDALKIIEKDINLAFHYRDLEQEMNILIREKRKTLCLGQTSGSTTTTLQPGTPPPTPSGATATNKCPPLDTNGCTGPEDPLCKKSEARLSPTTEFKGNEHEISFATLNSGRTSEGIAQADYLKVGYSVRNCKPPGQTEMSTRCLLRRSSSWLEGDITRGGEETILLSNIEEFSLRYLGQGSQDWISEWDSAQGDAVSKGKYPDLVEISLTTAEGEGDRKKKISMQIVAQVRFTNPPTVSTSTIPNAGNSPGGDTP